MCVRKEIIVAVLGKNFFLDGWKVTFGLELNPIVDQYLMRKEEGEEKR
jgi:hypothetical protein